MSATQFLLSDFPRQHGRRRLRNRSGAHRRNRGAQRSRPASRRDRHAVDARGERQDRHKRAAAGWDPREHARARRLLRIRRRTSDRREGCGLCLRAGAGRHRRLRRRTRPADRVPDAADLEAARRHPAGIENKDLARTRAIANGQVTRSGSSANAMSTAPKPLDRLGRPAAGGAPWHELEAAIRAGAVVALRQTRRSASANRAADWTVTSRRTACASFARRGPLRRADRRSLDASRRRARSGGGRHERAARSRTRQASAEQSRKATAAIASGWPRNGSTP